MPPHAPPATDGLPCFPLAARTALRYPTLMRSLLPACVALLTLACSTPPAPPSVLEASTTASARAGDDPTQVAPDATTTPALGARDPLVVVTFFTDYQCPNCRRLHDIAARLLDRWPNEIQLQFRQLPLAMHPLARPAAAVALAAHRQERFACMNSALTRSRPSWTDLTEPAFNTFVTTTLAPFCHLDPTRLTRDLADPALAAQIDADWKLAGDLTIPGTPALLVDGLLARLWPSAGVPPALLLNALVRRSLRDARAQLATHATSLADLPLARLQANLGDIPLARRLLGSDR